LLYCESWRGVSAYSHTQFSLDCVRLASGTHTICRVPAGSDAQANSSIQVLFQVSGWVKRVRSDLNFDDVLLLLFLFLSRYCSSFVVVVVVVLPNYLSAIVSALTNLIDWGWHHTALFAVDPVWPMRGEFLLPWTTN
jgi:hypothetical protein